MTKSKTKKLLLGSFALLALGALITRKALADTLPTAIPGASYDTLFGNDDEAAWNNLIYVGGFGGGFGGTALSRSTSLGNSKGTVVIGSGGLVVGVAPPPISPWKP